jgi:tetratricopeptide (TPR) repeat protein
MKQLIYAIISIAVVGSAIGLYASRSKAPVAPAATTATESKPSEAVKNEPTATAIVAKRHEPRTVASAAESFPAAQVEAKPAAVAESAARVSTSFSPVGVKLAVDTLVSPQSSYSQKEAAWRQLKDSGNLDQAITELEQRVAGDPKTAEYSATLGQAYLTKCGTIQDVREQGILAMKADLAFDDALKTDPNNWEARFTKAVAMSYWPPQLNKGQEVIDDFTLLINQQEAQAPQPQFAQTYVWLGDQYQKSGRNDYALAVWQRGAALYPSDTALSKRLAQPAGQ